MFNRNHKLETMLKRKEKNQNKKNQKFFGFFRFPFKFFQINLKRFSKEQKTQFLLYRGTYLKTIRYCVLRILRNCFIDLFFVDTKEILTIFLCLIFSLLFFNFFVFVIDNCMSVSTYYVHMCLCICGLLLHLHLEYFEFYKQFQYKSK